MEQFPNISTAEAMLPVGDPPDDTVSSVIVISPSTFPNIDRDNEDAAVIAIPIDPGVSSKDVKIMRANAISNWEFVALDTRVEDDMAYADTRSGGVFVASSEVNTALIAGLAITALLLLVIGISVGGLVIYFLVRREKWQKTKDNARKFKHKVTRSFAKQV